MKLRNKKTGEIWFVSQILIEPDGIEAALYKDDGVPFDKEYGSLAELNEEWEDYAPKEPLIKDEEIRKAVRVWAEACRISDSEKLRVCQGHGCSFIQLEASDAQFSLLGVDYGIPYDDYCTITELCGEDEE